MTKTIRTPTFQVQAGGETITIKPFTFGQLPTVTRHIANIAAQATGGDISIPALVATGGEDILAILCVATGKSREWFDTLEDHAEGIALITAVVEANKERFAKNLLPALTNLAEAVTGKTAKD